MIFASTDPGQWPPLDEMLPLERAFVRFLATLSDEPPSPALLLAAAWAVRAEQQGHPCLALDELAEGAAPFLQLEGDALLRIREVWAAAVAADPEWMRHPLVAITPDAAAGNTPLVLHGHRLYLRRLWRCEEQVGRGLHERASAMDTAGTHAAAQSWLARLFPPRPDGQIDWQRRACEIALAGRFTIITGGPGTGKTYTAARLYALLCLLCAGTPGAAMPRIALAAPTGKAAGRLQQSIVKALESLHAVLGDELPPEAGPDRVPGAQTLHRLLGAHRETRSYARNAARPLDCDVLFIDEASMVDLEMMAALLSALRPEARLVLLGDRDQLASVEAGAVLAELCDAPAGSPLAGRVVALQRSHRFADGIGALAAAINKGDLTATLDAFRQDPRIHLRLGATPTAVVDEAVRGYRSWIEVLRSRPPDESSEGEVYREWVHALLQAFDRFRVLCAVRDEAWGVAGLNAAIERVLSASGDIEGGQEWYAGRPVMVTRNDPLLGLANGDIGLVLPSPGGGLRAWFSEGAALRSLSVARLPPVETAYALTIHKSQGSEFGHVLVVLGERLHAGLTRELLYTGVTRARTEVTLMGGDPEMLTATVQRRTRRCGGLLTTTGRG